MSPQLTGSELAWYLVGVALSSPINVLGLFLLLMVTVTLAWAQLNPRSKIDLVYVLVDRNTGNVTLAKFAGFGAFIASTWVLVQLAVSGKFDSGYASIYMLTWAGAKVASDFAKTREGGNEAGSGPAP